jgi:IclR family transcriptional regulator, pca regulon regulatory protein
VKSIFPISSPHEVVPADGDRVSVRRGDGREVPGPVCRSASPLRFSLVVALASSFYFSARIDQVLLPELQRIVGMYGDAASIATLDRRDVIYLAHHSEQRARRAAAVVGARYPAHATSMGRVLLAGLDPDAFEAWLERGPLAALTTRTVTEKDAFRGIIGEVRARGYATAVDQLDYGITALAVPVRGPSGETVAALNSSGYTGLVTVDRLVAER